MERAHSHYETLQVARTAPPEVIRAAYRALAQRHHPDQNPGNEGATRMMALINDAYRVLSDPKLKREHDERIKLVDDESLSSKKSYQSYSESHNSRGQSPTRDPKSEAPVKASYIDLDRDYEVFKRMLPYLALVLAAAVALIYIFDSMPR